VRDLSRSTNQVAPISSRFSEGAVLGGRHVATRELRDGTTGE